MEHDCGEKYTPRIHVWVARVPDPKVCPRCKTYLNALVKKEKKEAEVVNLGNT